MSRLKVSRTGLDFDLQLVDQLSDAWQVPTRQTKLPLVERGHGSSKCNRSVIDFDADSLHRRQAPLCQKNLDPPTEIRSGRITLHEINRHPFTSSPNKDLKAPESAASEMLANHH